MLLSLLKLYGRMVVIIQEVGLFKELYVCVFMLKEECVCEE